MQQQNTSGVWRGKTPWSLVFIFLFPYTHSRFVSQIFGIQIVFLTILICFGTFIAADGGRTIDDPFSNIFRFVPDGKGF